MNNSVEFGRYMDYFKNLNPTEAAWSFIPKEGLRTNMVLHLSKNEIIFATHCSMHVLELDNFIHHTFSIKPPLNNINYHMKMIPDTDKVMLLPF